MILFRYFWEYLFIFEWLNFLYWVKFLNFIIIIIMLFNIWVFDKGGYSYEFFVCVSNWEMFFSDVGCSVNVYDWVFFNRM